MLWLDRPRKRGRSPLLVSCSCLLLLLFVLGLHYWCSRCVTGEDEVPELRRLVARETGFVRCFIRGLAVVELSKPPAAGRGVSHRILNHELDSILGRSCDEGLRA